MQFAASFGGADACQQRYRDLCVPLSSLQLEDQELGVGHFGVVVRGLLRAKQQRRASFWHAPADRMSTSQPKAAETTAVAVKMLKGMSEELGTQFLVEARLMSVLQHPHLVRAMAVCEDTLPLCLAMELCPRGNLQQALRSKALTNGGADEFVVYVDLARQVAEALAYLHSKTCLHRDVAARNVLLADAAEGDGGDARCGVLAKLSDFGLARGVEREKEYYRVSGECGRSEGASKGRRASHCDPFPQWPWRAADLLSPAAACRRPQSFSDQAVPLRWQCPVASATRVFISKSDVYSFGVTLWEIFSGGSTPYAELAATEVTAAVRAGHLLKRPSASTRDEVLALIRDCTRMPDISQRPAMDIVAARLQQLQGGAIAPEAGQAAQRRSGAGLQSASASTSQLLPDLTSFGSWALADDTSESTL